VKFKWIILVVICCFATARFCHKQTQGFSLAKIHKLTSPSTSSGSQDQELLTQLFQRPFTYWGRGLQSFVFLSEDGTYVIKLFNNRYQRKSWYYSLCSHLPFLEQWARDKISYYRNQQQKVFQSYSIAYDDMREQTGLIYAHLSLTAYLPDTITLVDPLHIAHQLDPNQVGFIIQKKAELAYPTLLRLIQNRDTEGAKSALASLLDLILWKFHHGIRDNDPLIRTNIGFIGLTAMQLDVGPLSKDFSIADPDFMRQEVMRITASLKNWLNNQQCPELINYLDQELEKALSS